MNEEQEIQSAMLVRQLANMELYESVPGKLTAADTLNTLIRRARTIVFPDWERSAS